MDYIIREGKNQEIKTDGIMGLGNFPGDLFPSESVYRLQVEGANTANVLKVSTPQTRKTDRGK